MVMGEMEYRIEALARQVNQMIRVGIVRNTQPRKGTVVVELADSDGVFTRPIPVLMPRTTHNASYDMPDVGEQVVCIFLANGMEQGFVVGSPFSRVDRVPDGATQDMKIYQYQDGTHWSYDRKRHHEETRNQGSWSYIAQGRIKIRGQRIDLN